MKDIKKTLINYPYLERPAEIYERSCGHKIIFAYKKSSLINISSWVKTGSINENDENNGISHFLEHLMFKGTSKHKAGEFDRILEARGAVVNAATWKDYTFYYVTIPKGADSRNFKDTLELHADMMLNPVIPDNEIGAPFSLDAYVSEKRERHVVIEEIKMRKDQPWTMVYNQTNRNMYTSHPYKRDVIGNEKIIASVSREAVLDYYKTHYTPGNIITIVSGDLNPEEIIPEIAAEFDFKGRCNAPVQDFPAEEGIKETKYIESSADITTGFLMTGAVCSKASDIKTDMIMEMLAVVLGQGQSSRLYQELIEKADNPIFNAVSADYYQFKDGGNFFIQANFKPEYKEQAVNLIKNQIEKLADEGITVQELKKAKKKLKAGFAENSETVSDIAETIGFYMVSAGSLEGAARYLDTAEEITLEDVKNAAKKYLSLDKTVISLLMPSDKQYKE